MGLEGKPCVNKVEKPECRCMTQLSSNILPYSVLWMNSFWTGVLDGALYHQYTSWRNIFDRIVLPPPVHRLLKLFCWLVVVQQLTLLVFPFVTCLFQYMISFIYYRAISSPFSVLRSLYLTRDLYNLLPPAPVSWWAQWNSWSACLSRPDS